MHEEVQMATDEELEHRVRCKSLSWKVCARPEECARWEALQVFVTQAMLDAQILAVHQLLEIIGMFAEISKTAELACGDLLSIERVESKLKRRTFLAVSLQVFAE